MDTSHSRLSMTLAANSQSATLESRYNTPVYSLNRIAFFYPIKYIAG